MKTTILILLLTLSLRGQDNGGTKHFYAGFGITCISSSIANHYLDNPTKSCLIGFGAGALAGFSKEYIWDKAMKKGVFSYEDLATTVWGAAVGGIVIRCIIDWKEVGFIPRKAATTCFKVYPSKVLASFTAVPALTTNVAAA